MTVREIVAEWLKTNGFDGLCTSLPGCGCELDSLMPCEDERTPNCEPGYKVPCPGGDNCVLDGDCPFHIEQKKDKEK